MKTPATLPSPDKTQQSLGLKNTITKRINLMRTVSNLSSARETRQE